MYNLKKTSLQILAVAVAALYLGACPGLAPGPADAMKAFYGKVEAGQLDEALRHVSKTLLTTLPVEKLKLGLQKTSKEIEAKGGIKRIDVVSEKIKGQIAEVTLKIVYGNGNEETDSTTLVMEDGGWKIQS